MKIEYPDLSGTQNVLFIGDKKKTIIYCEDYSYIIAKCFIKTYDFKGANTFKTYEESFKFMSFRGVVSLYLGDFFLDYFRVPKKISEVLNFNELNEGENLIPLFRPLEVTVRFEEYNYDSNLKISENEIAGLKILPGKSDSILYKDKSSYHRGTANSLISFPVYSKVDGKFFKCLKNMNEEIIVNPISGIMSVFIYNKNLIIGDKVDFINLENGLNFSKGFYISKNSLQSVQVVWLDENFCLRIYEFTGKYILKNTHDLVNAHALVNGDDYMQVVEDNKGIELTINTGYIFKDDIELINSIIGSKKSWISFDQFRSFYSFICSSSELEEDSENSLIHFDLELKINNIKEDLISNDDYPEEKPNDNFEYDFIFNYKLQDNSILPNCTEISLEDVFDKSIEFIDWGDGTKDSNLSHSYKPSEDDDITIRIIVKNPTRCDFSKVRYIFEILKIPKSLIRLNLMGCLFDSVGIELLLDLVLKNHPEEGYIETIYSGEPRLEFHNYIHLGNQFSPILLSDKAISKAYLLMEKRWHIDYFKEYNEKDLPTTSRYQSSMYANCQWADSADYLITNTEIDDVNKKVKISAYSTVKPEKGDVDWSMFNYHGAFVKTSLGWELVDYHFSILAEGITEEFMLPANPGNNTYRIGQLKRFEKSDNLDFFQVWSKELNINYIIKKTTYWKILRDTEITFIATYEKMPSLWIFPLGAPNQVLIGQGYNLKPTALETTVIVSTESIAKDYIFWRATESGNYSIKFINFVLDSNGCPSQKFYPSFLLGFMGTDGKFNQIESTIGPNSNGFTTVNKDFRLYLEANTFLCLIFKNTLKPVSSVQFGKMLLKAGSELIIEKF